MKSCNTHGSYQEKNIKAYNFLREHEFMLADKKRINCYHEAISKYVNPGDIVLDLGTGTGILACFAAKQGARKVYAIDHAEIISVARDVAAFNNFNNIEFTKIHSKQFILDETVDVIIQEQMGNFLFDEHMVENVCDLRDRLLKKGGRIIPDVFELYIEPVKVRDSDHVPMIKELIIHDVDFSCVKNTKSEELYNYIWRNNPDSIEIFLCNPEPVYTFDLHSINPEKMPNQFSYCREVQQGGSMDGFIVYFRCIFDEEISFSTGPVKDRSISWKYWLFRMDSLDLKKGDIIQMCLQAVDLCNPVTWQWTLL